MTEAKIYPRTPQAVARAVLAEIDKDPAAFSMEAWADGLDRGEAIEPGTFTHGCGTTLCAAGWTAYAAGWELRLATDTGMLYGVKGGVTDSVDDIAQRELGLTDDETFWYAEEETAYNRLSEIAERA